MSEAFTRFIILTGPPGCGKTTLVKKVCDTLKNKNIQANGFFTEEIREGRERIGFDVVLLNGTRAPLARISSGAFSGPLVGRYAVDVKSFESFALPILTSHEKTSVVVLDEIGKMELLSRKFSETVAKFIDDKDSVILATVPAKSPKSISLIDTIKAHPNTLLITVDKGNRDLLADKIVNLIFEAKRKSSNTK